MLPSRLCTTAPLRGDDPEVRNRVHLRWDVVLVIISWGGMFSVIVRGSTFTSRSAIEIGREGRPLRGGPGWVLVVSRSG